MNSVQIFIGYPCRV